MKPTEPAKNSSPFPPPGPKPGKDPISKTLTRRPQAAARRGSAAGLRVPRLPLRLLALLSLTRCAELSITTREFRWAGNAGFFESCSAVMSPCNKCFLCRHPARKSSGCTSNNPLCPGLSYLGPICPACSVPVSLALSRSVLPCPDLSCLLGPVLSCLLCPGLSRLE